MESENNNKHIMRNALIFSITIIACIGGYFYYTNIFRNEVQNLIEIEPQKTEYGTVAPQDFPQELLTEAVAPLEQSYTLTYPEQQQQTVVFESVKSLEDNQRIYSEYLRNNGWSITTNSFDEKTVFFYATKDSTELSILVFFDESVAKNKVSISVLNTIK